VRLRQTPVSLFLGNWLGDSEHEFLSYR